MQQEKRSILVVDRSASTVFYTATLLRKLNYGVRTASSAEDALDSIAGSAPALVVTDAVLPGMSGAAMLARIKQNPSLNFIPVIVQTASEDPALREACTRAGCCGYFIKPAEPEELFRAIQTATETTPRKHIRISVALKAGIGDAAGPGGTAETLEVTSLSAGGLHVKTSVPLPAKSIVPLTLRLAGRQIRTTVEVLYGSANTSRPDAVSGMGLKFATIGPDDLKYIENYIKEQVLKDLS